MSAFRDYPSTMRTHPPLDDRSVEDLLAGRVPRDPTELDDVARVLVSLRSAAQGPCPRPNAALARVLTDGLPADLAIAPPAAAATRRWRPRLAYLRGSPATISALIAGLGAKLAGLGVVGKTAVALTTAAALAAGAAATDLPRTVGDALDRGAEHVPADGPQDAELGEVLPDDADEPSGRPDGAGDRARADDRPEQAPFGADEPGGAPTPGGRQRARQETTDTPASPRSDAGAERRQPAGPPATPAAPPRETPRGPRRQPPRNEAPAPPATGPTAPSVPRPDPGAAPEPAQPQPAPSPPQVSAPPAPADSAPQVAPHGAPTNPAPQRP